MKCLWFVIAVLLSATPGIGGLLTYSAGGLTSGTELTKGYRFRADSTVNVTALSLFDMDGDGLPGSYEVHLWSEASTSSPIATVSIPSGTGAPLSSGWFRTVALDSPVQLTSGSIFRIAADYGDADRSAEHLRSLTGTLEVDSHFSLLKHDTGVVVSSLKDAGVYTITNGAYPGTGTNSIHLGPNLEYSQTTALPEPGSFMIVAIGTMGLLAGQWRRRRRKPDV